MPAFASGGRRDGVALHGSRTDRPIPGADRTDGAQGAQYSMRFAIRTSAAKADSATQARRPPFASGPERRSAVKVTSFHFMPYRDLPADADERYPSMWVDAPWWELADAEKVGEQYNQSIDELMLAAKMGFDGLGTNEHHQ